MMYRLIKRKAVAELECSSDLIARQYAQADRQIERVETDSGRIVYRRVKESETAGDDADHQPRRKTT